MSQEHQQQPTAPRDSGYWANRVTALQVSAVPTGARNINVDGRQVTGPIQGFGQMWQKTYRVSLAGVADEPNQILSAWQANFGQFQPTMNHFYLTGEGFSPGQVALIDSDIANMPMVSTGVMVLYSDEQSFTFMTPEGHPEAGWITFSVDRDDEGEPVAQIQSLARAADPVYEVGFRLFGSRMQENIWRHVLTKLAEYYSVEAPVDITRICVDNKLQWNKAGNIWKNAQIRTTIHTVTTPYRATRTWLAR